MTFNKTWHELLHLCNIFATYVSLYIYFIIKLCFQNFINDAENLLASPKTPEGSGTSFTGATPGVIGAQEVYK